ncbi:MAG: hypothetical protein ACR2PW_00965 [Gammaproteobacteria bacterium]
MVPIASVAYADRYSITEDLWYSGHPAWDLWIRNLPQNAGSQVQPDLFAREGMAGSISFNLRGLGDDRTEVLLDGLRLGDTATAASDSARLYADMASVPMIAVDAIDIQLDGEDAQGKGARANIGAATVNLELARDFVGQRISYSQNHLNGVGDERQLAYLLGTTGVNGQHLLLAVEARDQSPLALSERTSVSNPLSAGYTVPVPQAECQAAQAHWSASSCVYYPGFATRIRAESEQYRMLGLYQVPLLTGSFVEVGMLLNHHESELTAPSYWPFRLVQAQELPDSANPGLADYLARNSEDLSNFSVQDVLGLSAGLGGSAIPSYRHRSQYRFHFRRYRGAPGDAFYYNAALVVANSSAQIQDHQIDSDRFNRALLGFGGVGCDVAGVVSGASTAGQGGCEYYNPFVTGWGQIGTEDNPLLYQDGNAALDPQTSSAYTESQLQSLINSQELRDWLGFRQSQRLRSTMTDVNLHYGGAIGTEHKRSIHWQAGAVWRYQGFKRSVEEPVNADSLAGVQLRRFSRNWFTDWHFNLNAALELGMSLRHEDYGATGSYWLPAFTLNVGRSAARLFYRYSNTLSVPGLPQLGGVHRTFALEHGADAGILRRREVAPRADLKPEEIERHHWGLKGQWSAFNVSVTAFELRIDELIVAERSTGAEDLVELYTWQQGGVLEVEGFDAAVQWHLGTGTKLQWQLGGNLSRISDWHGNVSGDLASRPVPELSVLTFVHLTAAQRHHVRIEQIRRQDYWHLDPEISLAWEQWNVHYLYRYRDGRTRLYLSLFNASNSAPVSTGTALGYESSTQSVAGDMIKIGLHHNF